MKTILKYLIKKAKKRGQIFLFPYFFVLQKYYPMEACV